jgi:hypothetical protein
MTEEERIKEIKKVERELQALNDELDNLYCKIDQKENELFQLNNN